MGLASSAVLHHRVVQSRLTSVTAPAAAHFKLSKLKSDDELVTGLHALIYKRQGTVSGEST